MGNMSLLHAVILAAGQGTRMPSPRPKVLQTLLGETMISLVHATVASLPDVAGIWTVIGHGGDQVRAELERFAQRGVAAPVPAGFVEQTERLGTGHALMTAMPALQAAGAERILVLNGDVPLVSAAALRDFMTRAEGSDLAFLTLTLPDAGAYGRVLRQGGRVIGIVEKKDYDPVVHGPDSGEINTGVYLISRSAAGLLPRLTTGNKAGEYYLTDLVALAEREGLAVAGVPAGDDALSLLGVNNPVELAAAEAGLQARRVAELLASGVIVHAPESVRAGAFVRVEPGAELFGPCELYGDTVIEHGARVESHCVLHSARVASGAALRGFCHVEDADIGPGCVVGPYARLRPGAVLEEGAHVGNFVEMKKTRLGRGAKANHLTYLGDAEVGPGVNVGAGTITCNYDGVHKHRTVIKTGAFIGSNTALVAPVTVGEKALVGAGSVITKDVPDGGMAIARARQANLKKKG